MPSGKQHFIAVTVRTHHLFSDSYGAAIVFNSLEELDFVLKEHGVDRTEWLAVPLVNLDPGTRRRFNATQKVPS